MRSLGMLLGLAGIVAAASTLARADANESPENLLKTFRPSLSGVDYEIPTDKAAIAACKVEKVYNAKKKPIGWSLRDGQGKLLRRFVDTKDSINIDQWSYYQDGFEVYRENDTNDDRNLDECRWLNAGGTRIAKVESFQASPNVWRVRVAEWKRLSAEEASKVFVQALVARDLRLLETVVATPKELTGLGLTSGVIDKAVESASNRAERCNALIRGLSGWDTRTVWSRLDGMMPHLIPAGQETGLKDDLMLYENAVIFPGAPNGQQNVQMAFLQAPEIVKIGETWKFVDLPRAVDPAKPLVAMEGGVRAAIFGAVAAGGAGGQGDPELDKALKNLADFDQKNAGVNLADNKAVASFNRGRVPLLNAAVRASKNPDEKLAFHKQIVDCLAAAYQTGFFPEGSKLLEKIIEQPGQSEQVQSYAKFRLISAEYTLANNKGVNPAVSQKKWMTELKGFLDKFPKCDEAPDALMQMASANEYAAEEDEARKYYTDLARDFPDTDAGKKASGALKRLDLVGKPFALKGPSQKHGAIDAAQYRGKPLLVMFWASWADPAKRDLPDLVKLYQKYHEKGFEIVGVCLDDKPKDLEAFLEANPLPWPQVYVPGGLEKNPFAIDYGIVALPTMILVDAQGKVVNRAIPSTSELEKQLEGLLAANGGGVALGAGQ